MLWASIAYLGVVLWIPGSGRERELRMSAPRPLIYFDHWALRRFASNLTEQSRLLAALRIRGTLAISLVNLMEFSGHDEGESLREIREFLASLDPSYCLIDWGIFEVIKRWQTLGLPEERAALDLELAQRFASRARAHSGSISPVLLVEWAREHVDEVRATTESMKARFHGLLTRAQHFHRESGRLMQVRHSESAIHRCMVGLINRAVSADNEVALNDTVDLFHATVPLAVCDFVLLDKRWVGYADSLPRPPRRAQVFSGKRGQITAFLDALKRFTPPPEVK